MKFKLKAPYKPAGSQPEAIKSLVSGLQKGMKKQYPRIGRHFKEGIQEYYFTYLKFYYQVRRMIYTTNWIERLNKDVRKLTKNKNSFPSEKSMLNLVWQALIQREEKTYHYPITQFYQVQEELFQMFQ